MSTADQLRSKPYKELNSEADRLVPKPYKGLIPYSEEDRLFFFGREREREIITEKLKAWNLTIIYGASGVGKSSLLRAGVAYHLSQAAQKNVDETGKPGWAIIVFPPIEGDLAGKVSWQDPLKGIEEQLKVEIAQLFELTLTEIEEKFKQEIANLFKDAPPPPQDISLVDKLKAWANIIQDEEGSSRLFIILDQFEEYSVQLQQKKNNDAFLDELQKAVNSSEVSINVLISIRKEFYYSLDCLTDIPNLYKYRRAIKHLDQESAREALVNPIKEYNRQKIILEKFLDDSRLTILAGEKNTHKSTILRSAITRYLKKSNSNHVVFFNHWRKYLKQKKPESSLVDILSTRTKNANDRKQSETRLFVILDQFEEYFWKQQEIDPDRKFINELLSIINDDSLSIKFLISIRESWLPELEAYQNRLPDSCQSYLQLSAKEENFIEEKSLDPSKVITNKLEEQFIEIEPGLDEQILQQFKEEHSGMDRRNPETADEKAQSETEFEVEAPILQLVMTRLWKEARESGLKLLKKDQFNKIGGLKGILEDHVKTQMSRLSDEEDGEKDIAARIFPYLVTKSQIKIALPVEDLRYFANKDQKNILEQDRIRDLLNKLSDIKSDQEDKDESYRILRSLQGIGEKVRYEIYHDMMAKSILAWQTEYDLEKRNREAEKEQKKRIKAAEKQAKLIREEGKKQASHFKIKADLANLQAKKAKGRADQAEAQARLAKQQSRQAENRARLAKQQSRQAENRARLAKQQSRQAENRASQAENRVKQLRRTVRYLGIFLGIFAIATVITGRGLTWYFSHTTSRISQIKVAVSEFEQAQAQVKSGKTGKLIALARAIGVRKELQDPLKDLKRIPFFNTDQYTSKAEDSLKTILKDIKEKNQLQIENPVLSVRFGRNRKNLAIFSTDIAYLWNWKDDKHPKKIKGYKDDVSIARFNFEENTLATVHTNVSPGNWIRLFNVQNSQLEQIDEFQVHQQDDKEPIGVSSISFSPDGQQLAIGSADETVFLRNLQNQQLAKFKGHQDDKKSIGAVRSISFSPKGQHLATGSADGIVRLWNLQDKQFVEFKGHQDDKEPIGAVWSISFSSDGQYLATGSADGIVRLWNLQDKQLVEFKGHQDDVLNVSFSLDGQYLATGSADESVRLWDLQEKPSLDDESLDELLERGCVWLEDYLTTHPEKQEELSEQCPNPSPNDK